MITQQTVLILGAGASYPYGFSLAKGLYQNVVHIISKRDPEGRFWSDDAVAQGRGGVDSDRMTRTATELAVLVPGVGLGLYGLNIQHRTRNTQAPPRPFDVAHGLRQAQGLRQGFRLH